MISTHLSHSENCGEYELKVLPAPIDVKIFSNRKLALALELEKLQQRAGGVVEEVIHFHASKTHHLTLI